MLQRFFFWLISNSISIILSILLAITVWIVASLEQNPFEEADLAVPVEIDVVGLEEGLVITNDYPETTRVRLRAQQQTWRSLSAEDILVTADLSGLPPGVHQVELDFKIDAQALLISINPRHIRLEIEERYQREMPIQLVLEGAPAIGFSVESQSISPALVTVEGPRSNVQQISEIRATIAVADRRDTLRAALPLVPLDKDGQVIEDVTITPASVSVVVPIRQEAGYRDISIIANPTGRVAPGYYVRGIDVNPQFITVQGDPSIIESMQPYAETEPIDLTGRTEDFSQPVQISLPEGVTPVEAQTVEVLVTIVAQETSRTVLDVPVEIEGLEEELVAELSPGLVDIILTGPLTELDTLNPQTDIIVSVDVSNLRPGIHQVEPEVRVLRQDVLVESLFPPSVQVEIAEDNSVDQ